MMRPVSPLTEVTRFSRSITFSSWLQKFGRSLHFWRWFTSPAEASSAHTRTLTGSYDLGSKHTDKVSDDM
jgi:hypothetical protein